MHSPPAVGQGPHAALPPWGQTEQAFVPPGPSQRAFHPCLLTPPALCHSMMSISPHAGHFTSPGGGPSLMFSPSNQTAGHRPDSGGPARSASGSLARNSM